MFVEKQHIRKKEKREVVQYLVPLNGTCANTSWRSSTHQEESRHAYKNRAKRHWVASELAGSFLPFANTENQFLSTFDSPSFRRQSKSDSLKINVCSWPRLQPGVGRGTSGCKLDCQRLGRKALCTTADRLLYGSTFVALSALWVFHDKAQEWQHCQILVRISFLALLHHLLLLFQVDLASHWTCERVTRSCRTPLIGTQTEGWRSARQGIISLSQASFVLGFFFFNRSPRKI